MLSNRNFYYSITKKMVSIFGTIFDNITLIRYNPETKAEESRIKVPILYGPKEKWITRLDTDPNFNKEVAITLPRMSFDITGFSYNKSRQLNRLQSTVKANTAAYGSQQYVGTPWDIEFSLSIYSRNIDDANQIIEQILPYFTPEYTVTATLIPELGITKDIPITLNSVSQNIQYEGDQENAVRYVYWDLTFTMKTEYYGPINNKGLIRTVIVNLYDDPTLRSNYILVTNLTPGGNGTFLIDDIVYSGLNKEAAYATGKVVKWESDIRKLSLSDVQGQFSSNSKIHAISTNASWTISSFDASQAKAATITITPVPSDAEPTDDYGYSTVITEYPETL